MPTPKTEAVVSAPDGTRYEVTATDEGLTVWLPSGGQLMVGPSGAGNVVNLIPWPTSQPVLPPTPERPVQASRDLVLEVMAPKSNGVGQEAVDAVQTRVEAEPAFRDMLVGIIRQTLTKRTSEGYGYETLVVREDVQA